jgi:alanine racemase
MDYLQRTWCEIDLDALADNIRILKEIAGKELMAVVKADAYGHGDRGIALRLQQEGIRFFAVSNINEAMNLRHFGITGKILVLGYTPPKLADLLIVNQIIQTVHCLEYGRALNRAATAGKVLCHLKADTGMSRLGFVISEGEECIDEMTELVSCANLDICGIFTHFSCSDSFLKDDVDFTNRQMERLDWAVTELEKRGISLKTVHAQNSAGITNYENDRYNVARAGILMYGLRPSDDVKGIVPVKPLLSWKTVVTMVKEVPAGTDIGYGRTYRTKGSMRVATLAVGYADGYYRSFSSAADVLIHGCRCKILGRVCMDQIMVDVSGISEVEIGDVATLIGRDGKEMITADELAKIAGTINYEVVCSISRRVARVYIQNGEKVEAVDYSVQ